MSNKNLMLEFSRFPRCRPTLALADILGLLLESAGCLHDADPTRSAK